MPPKKSTGGQKAVVPDPTVLPDGGDPALVAMAIVDKKKRNLEKRKVPWVYPCYRTCLHMLRSLLQNKLESLKEGLDSGTRLDTDQIAAVAKLNDVSIQLELIKELQKQFTTLQSDVCAHLYLNNLSKVHVSQCSFKKAGRDSRKLIDWLPERVRRRPSVRLWCIPSGYRTS